MDFGDESATNRAQQPDAGLGIALSNPCATPAIGVAKPITGRSALRM